jgi:biopolymer transport protein ExbD
LKTQIAVISTKSEADQPEVQVDAADQVPYQVVARVLADAKSYGLNKIGFTDSNGQ